MYRLPSNFTLLVGVSFHDRGHFYRAFPTVVVHHWIHPERSALCRITSKSYGKSKDPIWIFWIQAPSKRVFELSSELIKRAVRGSAASNPSRHCLAVYGAAAGQETPCWIECWIWQWRRAVGGVDWEARRPLHTAATHFCCLCCLCCCRKTLV